MDDEAVGKDQEIYWERQQKIEEANARDQDTTYDLSFDQLRGANEARRCKIHQQKGKWSLTDWMTALCGEVGEAANIIKKIRRQDFTLEAGRSELAKEFGDIVCYLDLLASECGINLGSAVAAKFNEVSRRHGNTIFIQPDGDWTDTRGGEHDNPVFAQRDQARAAREARVKRESEAWAEYQRQVNDPSFLDYNGR